MTRTRPPIPPFTAEAVAQKVRAYGNENWEFDDNGLMRRGITSINDIPITNSQRVYLWPLGRRPSGHPGLDELGL